MITLILPYNDAMLKYLDYLIEEESDKVLLAKAGCEPLEALTKRRREYEEQIQVLTKSMEAGGTYKLLDERGVEDLVKSLYSLKHWGKNLEENKTRAEESQRRTYREQPFRLTKPINRGEPKVVNKDQQPNPSFLAKFSSYFRRRSPT